MPAPNDLQKPTLEWKCLPCKTQSSCQSSVFCVGLVGNTKDEGLLEDRQSAGETLRRGQIKPLVH